MLVKGIPSLKFFSLVIENVTSVESLGPVIEWKDHVSSLDIAPFSSFPVHMKYLEELHIWTGEENDLDYDGQDAIDTINAHRSSLRRLTIIHKEGLNGKIQSLKIIPHLEYLSIYGEAAPFHVIKSLLDAGKNITVLKLFDIDITGINPTGLRLPHLKQLSIDSPKALGVLKANANQIEILHVENWTNAVWNVYPESLPSLKILAFQYKNDFNIQVISKFLEASVDSLQHLAIYCAAGKDYNTLNNQLATMEVPQMKNLISFMFDHISRLSDLIISQSSETLESIYVGMDDNYYKKLTLPSQLLKLKKVVMTYLEEEFITRQSYFEMMKRAYPLAEIKVEKVESYVSFANVLLRKLGADVRLCFTSV